MVSLLNTEELEKLQGQFIQKLEGHLVVAVDAPAIDRKLPLSTKQAILTYPAVLT